MINIKQVGIALAGLVAAGAAHAQTATTTVTTMKQAPLQVVATGVTVQCTWPAGTVVLTLGTTGGDNNAVTYSLGGTPSGDFAISGNKLVVGPNGVAAANCGKVETVTINATQP